jgi:hypothetical protein
MRRLYPKLMALTMGTVVAAKFISDCCYDWPWLGWIFGDCPPPWEFPTY